MLSVPGPWISVGDQLDLVYDVSFVGTEPDAVPGPFHRDHDPFLTRGKNTLNFRVEFFRAFADPSDIAASAEEAHSCGPHPPLAVATHDLDRSAAGASVTDTRPDAHPAAIHRIGGEERCRP